jgi:Tfp pilus assembly protein PilF
MITIADQYYLKALDEYPYTLDTSIEHLNYALSYDPEHVGANYLMARVYLEQFDDTDKAEEYFQEALTYDPSNYKVCSRYALMLINLRAFKKAEKVIRHMESLKGRVMADLYQTKAVMCEYKKAYDEAEMLLKLAMEETYNDDFMRFLESELDRVQKKMKRAQTYVYETD